MFHKAFKYGNKCRIIGFTKNNSLQNTFIEMNNIMVPERLRIGKHCSYCHLISTPTNSHTYNFYIKTFKIAPKCFDPKIIFRKLIAKVTFLKTLTYICASVGVLIKWLYEMHGATIKLLNAQQAKLNDYKNTKLKLLNKWVFLKNVTLARNSVAPWRWS